MKCESSFRVELAVYDADGYKMDILKRPLNKIQTIPHLNFIYIRHSHLIKAPQHLNLRSWCLGHYLLLLDLAANVFEKGFVRNGQTICHKLNV